MNNIFEKLNLLWLLYSSGLSILKFNNKLKGADLVMASHCHSTFRMVLVKLAVLPHSAGIVK